MTTEHNPWNLSPKRFKVAQMMADGFTRREIQEILEICQRTFEEHIRCVKKRMKVATRSGIILEMWRNEQKILRNQANLRLLENLSRRSTAVVNTR